MPAVAWPGLSNNGGAGAQRSWSTTPVGGGSGTGDCSWDLTVPATDGPTYSPADREADIIYLRYVVWDANSDQGDDGLATIYDPFSITMNYACSDDSVIIAPADDIGT